MLCVCLFVCVGGDCGNQQSISVGRCVLLWVELCGAWVGALAQTNKMSGRGGTSGSSDRRGSGDPHPPYNNNNNSRMNNNNDYYRGGGRGGGERYLSHDRGGGDRHSAEFRGGRGGYPGNRGGGGEGYYYGGEYTGGRGFGGGGRGGTMGNEGTFDGRGGGGGPSADPNVRSQQQQQQQQGRRKVPSNVVTFDSFEEERDWVEERRRKRLARSSRFDVTPQQLGIPLPPDGGVPGFSHPHHQYTNPATSFLNANNDPSAIAAAAAAALQTMLPPSSSSMMMLDHHQHRGGNNAAMALPQQTRHARRLYVGNLPLNIAEHQIMNAFREAIQLTLQPGPGVDLNEDPILSVYINQERRFCFLEFKTVEMCSACMALDGLEVVPGQAPVKVKRPNDYQPGQAPPELFQPILDLSKLGIISPTVQDGPNKIFIGGLHYHLHDTQVLELLQAFGKVKSFHLVKNEPDTSLSKGYCFVEYADPAVTTIAVAGLNGMDIGGGKSLTARQAGHRPGTVAAAAPMAMSAAEPLLPTATLPAGSLPDQNKTIVAGYDVEAMVNAAMGQGPMPSGPTFFDSFQQPLTRVVPLLYYPRPPPVAALPPIIHSVPISFVEPPSSNVNLAISDESSRVLVLLNMVTDDDLATEEDHRSLLEEVREECAKFGDLRDIKIPRETGDGVDASALRKVYLLYASPEEASQADKELTGRQFGPNVVETQYYSESDFTSGLLR